MYSLLSLDKACGSNDYFLDPETVAAGMRILLGEVSRISPGTHRCLAQYLYSTFFRIASWHWVV
jgi:hypothetical protein